MNGNGGWNTSQMLAVELIDEVLLVLELFSRPAGENVEPAALGYNSAVCFWWLTVM